MRCFILMFLFCRAYTGAAQSDDCAYPLRGLVEDNQGNALIGATVWIETSQTGTSSAADGTFVITELCAGTIRLLIRYIGYEDQRITVRIPAQRQLIVTMRPSTQVLHDIVIEGEHTQQHGLSQALNILTEEELNARSGKALGELINQVPGVTSMMTGPGIYKPVIHGLHSQRILILNNAIRQEGQQWGVEHAPEIDPYIAAEVEVVKGAEAVRYGADALGGVIIVNPAPLHYSAGFGGELHAAFMSNNRMGVISGMLEGGSAPPKGLAWRVQGTAKKGGDYHAPDYTLSNTGTEEFNFSGTIGLKKETHEVELYVSSFNTEIGILRSAHTGNLDDLQQSIIRERPWYIADFTYTINNPRQSIGHHLMKLKASKQIASLGTLNFLYGGQFNQRKEFDIRRGGRNNRPALSLDLFSHVVDVTLDHNVANWSGTVGLNGTLKDNNNVLGIGILPDYDQYAGGIFVLGKHRKEKWLVEAGLRYDHQYLRVITFDDQNNVLRPGYTFNYVSGSAGTSYYVNTRSRLSSHFAVSVRPPHVSELYSQGLHHGVAAIEEGLMIRQDGVIDTDPSHVTKERSHKWVNSYQYTDERFSAELTAYANYIRDYIYLQPYETRLTIRGYFPVFRYRQTDAILAGGDLSLGWNMTKRLRYAGKASYLYAENISQNGKLPFIPPVQFDNAVVYTWPSVGNWKDLHVKLSALTVLRQYRAPRTLYPADIPAQNFEETSTFDFMSPPSGYTLVNLEIGAKFPMGNRDLSLTLSADNVLNTGYRNYMNRLRYYADEAGRNVMVRVKYNFHSH